MKLTQIYSLTYIDNTNRNMSLRNKVQPSDSNFEFAGG